MIVKCPKTGLHKIGKSLKILFREMIFIFVKHFFIKLKKFKTEKSNFQKRLLGSWNIF